MKIAIHQPNFIPHFPYFYKMAMVDKFIILGHVNFEKNGYQNRYKLSLNKIGQSSDGWSTKSVESGTEKIVYKKYADGQSLSLINMSWILTIKATLSIKTTIEYDYPTDLTGTDRLIDLVKHYGGDCYVTNPEAKDKYLDEELMENEGIKIEYCKVPKNLQIPIFEAFDRYGIDGLIKQLPEKKDAISRTVLQLSE